MVIHDCVSHQPGNTVSLDHAFEIVVINDVGLIQHRFDDLRNRRES